MGESVFDRFRRKPKKAQLRGCTFHAQNTTQLFPDGTAAKSVFRQISVKEGNMSSYRRLSLPHNAD